LNAYPRGKRVVGLSKIALACTGATTYANTVSPTSTRLTQTQDITGTVAIQYDAAGSITADGTHTFTYSDRGRVAAASNAEGTVNYLYNAFNLWGIKPLYALLSKVCALPLYAARRLQF
jgi:hypothetical protein